MPKPLPPAVHLDGVTQRYGDTTILEPTTLSISSGEVVALLGPSGCGKSTILKYIAGLSQPSAGQAWCFGEPITSPGPDRAVVFQHHALLPWKTALGNITFALANARPELSRAQRAEIAREMLDSVGLGHAAHRRPGQLSGGMQQRVGIARALSLHANIVLLDEPFGALDAITRMDLQELFRSMCTQHQLTALVVTHDVEEALLLADRIVVMGPSPHATIVDEFTTARQEDHPRIREEILRLLHPDTHRVPVNA